MYNSVQSASEKAAKDLFQMYEAVKDEETSEAKYVKCCKSFLDGYTKLNSQKIDYLLMMTLRIQMILCATLFRW